MTKALPQTFKKEDIEKYQQLFLKYYQEDLTYEEAEASLRNFLSFM